MSKEELTKAKENDSTRISVKWLISGVTGNRKLE